MTADLLEIDRIVCRGIGKRPGQSINERARELLKSRTGTIRQEQACRILLGAGEPWDCMRRAANALGLRPVPGGTS